MVTHVDINRLATARMDDLTERYVAIRAKKKALEAELAAKLEPLEAGLDALATAMLTKLHQEGAKSQATPHGTVYIATTSTAKIVDFEAMWQFAKENDVPEILQKRVSLSELEAYNESHPDAPVPGVVSEKIQSARVRAK